MPAMEIKIKVLSAVSSSAVGRPRDRHWYMRYGIARMTGTNSNISTLPNHVKNASRSLIHGVFGDSGIGGGTGSPVSAYCPRVPSASVDSGVFCVEGSFVITRRVYHG
jgi:hypothetical protein